MRRSLCPIIIVLVIAILLVIILTGCGAPMANTSITPNLSSTVHNSSEGTPAEAIQVHGHWIFEVRNPDGTLAERRELDNALASNGNLVICSFLGRKNSVGAWHIGLGGGDPPFVNSFLAATGGLIVENSYPITDSPHFRNLTVSIPTSGENVNKLVLSGTAIAGRDGQIANVTTAVMMLPPTQVPQSSYVGDGQYVLTATTLSSPVSLTKGQQVSVTVVISFS
jgi:hypothetical protein